MKTFAHASVSSRRRRTVLQSIMRPISSLAEKEETNLRTVAAAVVDTVHAPPAMTLRHARHFQIPTFVRLTAS